MNHAQVYANIINKAKQRSLDNPLTYYSENHHIIPRCLGGGDEPENRVDLTAKEHFVVHALLCYIFPNSDSLAMAFNIMRNCKKTDQERYISGSEYRVLRERASKAISNNLLGNTNFTNSEYFISGEHSRQLSIRNVGNTHFKGKSHTQESCDKISKALLGNNNGSGNLGNEYPSMYGNTNALGNKLTEEHKAAISKAQIGNKHAVGPQKKFPCQYCGQVTSKAALSTFHGPNAGQSNNNCRSKSIELGTWPQQELLAA